MGAGLRVRPISGGQRTPRAAVPVRTGRAFGARPRSPNDVLPGEPAGRGPAVPAGRLPRGREVSGHERVAGRSTQPALDAYALSRRSEATRRVLAEVGRGDGSTRPRLHRRGLEYTLSRRPLPGP